MGSLSHQILFLRAFTIITMKQQGYLLLNVINLLIINLNSMIFISFDSHSSYLNFDSKENEDFISYLVCFDRLSELENS
jgi:hypothetical protein